MTLKRGRSSLWLCLDLLDGKLKGQNRPQSSNGGRHEDRGEKGAQVLCRDAAKEVWGSPLEVRCIMGLDGSWVKIHLLTIGQSTKQQVLKKNAAYACEDLSCDGSSD